MWAFDCNELNPGGWASYACEYEMLIEFFKRLAFSESSAVLSNVPLSWVPFVRYLGHDVLTVRRVEAWKDAEAIDWTSAYEHASDVRRVVEMASVCRPELVHALYMADTEWPCPLRKHTDQRAFTVTCNGSFFRPEVQAYRAALRAFIPPHMEPRSAVLVPCSASKPYPSPVHAQVLQLLAQRPEPWHLIVVSGTLGMTPVELWPVAPLYDAGLPHPERVEQTVRWYFAKHFYERVVCFSDFYGHAVRRAITALPASHRPRASYVLGSYWRDGYDNVLLPEHLNALEEALAR